MTTFKTMITIDRSSVGRYLNCEVIDKLYSLKDMYKLYFAAALSSAVLLI